MRGSRGPCRRKAIALRLVEILEQKIGSQTSLFVTRDEPFDVLAGEARVDALVVGKLAIWPKFVRGMQSTPAGAKDAVDLAARMRGRWRRTGT